MAKVICGEQGFYNTEPTCNAAAHIDRLVLGLQHMNPVAWYKHLPVCRDDQGMNITPDWCLAPFESDGILTTLSATATTLLGLHFGHVLVENQQHLARLWAWTFPSAGLVVVGMALHNVGLLFNRQLWSFSYLCFTAGTAGTLLSSVYFLVEANGWRGGFSPLLQLVGRHSLLLFGLFNCDLLPTFLQGFYHRCPQNSLWSFLRDHHVAHRILHLLEGRFSH
jgi:heparan-alpha-glucosaminide N-acetyltransferase